MGNLSALFPRALELACSFFRVTRGAKDDPWAGQTGDEDVDLSPGAIIGMVTAELTARKYAGVVRLEVSAGTPVGLPGWPAAQLGAGPAGVIAAPGLLGLGNLMGLPVVGHAGQRDPPHEPVTHPRLRESGPHRPVRGVRRDPPRGHPGAPALPQLRHLDPAVLAECRCGSRRARDQAHDLPHRPPLPDHPGAQRGRTRARASARKPQAGPRGHDLPLDLPLNLILARKIGWGILIERFRLGTVQASVLRFDRLNAASPSGACQQVALAVRSGPPKSAIPKLGVRVLPSSSDAAHLNAGGLV